MKSLLNITFCFEILIIIFIKVCKSDGIFDVTKFGADIKGKTKSTEAVNKAIAAAVSKGGGTVYFPKGEYLCGPIHLKTNITLELADNTIIRFSNDFEDYLPMVRQRWEGTELINSSPLIYAYKQQNIVIKGKGILDGQGSHWWQTWRQLAQIYQKTGKRDTKLQKEFLKSNNLTEIKSETDDMSRIDLAFLRPPFIQPFDSKNILIQDVTVRNSPFWNLNPVYCHNITIRDVRIEAPNEIPNTDGIDPDSCKDVFISNVTIDVGDDCIAIKSGRDLQGRRIGRPTENVVISDSIMLRGGSGVAIGSEQSGGVRNVTVRNCVFNGTKRGLFLKSMPGRGGIVENIHFHNISMINIITQSIIISLGDRQRTTPLPFTERTPVFRNIEFKELKCNSNYSDFQLSGLPESLLENIKISNIDIKFNYSLTANHSTNLQIIGISEKDN